MFDFTLGTRSVSMKATTEMAGAKRRGKSKSRGSNIELIIGRNDLFDAIAGLVVLDHRRFYPAAAAADLASKRNPL